MTAILTPDDIKKYILTSLILAAVCFLAMVYMIACGGDADIYIKDSIGGTGSGSITHEGRLSDAAGFQDASISYNYEKTVTEEGTHSQTVEFMMAGGDGSYWNYQRIWTDKQIAGHNSMDIRVGQISGSYYAKSGMTISYNAANETNEEFESTITIDTRDGNASIQFGVIQWQGAGEPIPEYDEGGNFTGYAGGESAGKPVSLSDIDLVGGFLVEEIVRLKEPIISPGDWLGFCSSLDDKLPDGFIVRPVGLTYGQNGTAWSENSTLIPIDV